MTVPSAPNLNIEKQEDRRELTRAITEMGTERANLNKILKWAQIPSMLKNVPRVHPRNIHNT